jgi:hypothetical protein
MQRDKQCSQRQEHEPILRALCLNKPHVDQLALADAGLTELVLKAKRFLLITKASTVCSLAMLLIATVRSRLTAAKGCVLDAPTSIQNVALAARDPNIGFELSLFVIGLLTVIYVSTVSDTGHSA